MSSKEDDKTKKKVKKPSAEVLQKRKEGRIRAAATLASNLKKTGIMRVEDENGFKPTNIKSIPLINQKNYFTDYLKKDDQILFIRNWRTEKLLKQKLKTLKDAKANGNQTGNGNNDDEGGQGNGPKNFDDFNLNDIEEEMRKKAIDNDNLNDDDDDDDDDDENADVEVDAEVADGEGDAEAGENGANASGGKVRHGADVIVLHPGSSNLRIGKATDAVPITIPSVVAMKQAQPVSAEEYLPPAPERTVIPSKTNGDSANNGADDETISFGDEFESIKAEMTKDFKARMRYYKRRILPNSRETAANFNKRQEPESIPEHNDPHKKDWIDIKEHPDKVMFFGEDALNLPICETFNNWKLRHPIVNGKFNESPKDYYSREEILGDLTGIVSYGLQKLDISNPQGYKCILIIPDLYDKMVVENWIELLFKFVGFGKVGIIQESVAASFGAGTSSACIVDVGSQTTTVSCVDEGLVINDSRIKLNYGGDNITDVFIKFLLQQKFPYKQINLNYNYDWELAQTLKHNFATFQDADIAVQTYNFYKRKPFENTLKYDFKVFDEVMLAPLGLFYPEIFSTKPNHLYNFFGKALDHYSMKSNNPYSKSQENLVKNSNYTTLTDEDLLYRLSEEKSNNLKSNNPFAKAKFTNTDLNETPVFFPLERAIIESITNSGLATDFNKAKKFYNNLLIIGGGISKIPGYDLLMTDRINIWRPRILSTSNMDEIFEYTSGLEKQSETTRKQLIEEKIKSLGVNNESEIPPEDMQQIDRKCQVTFDLDQIDNMIDSGGLLPVNVLPPPREFDPEMLTWKGGSVYGRLKVVSEMWISKSDWDLLQSRCLYYKTLFNY